MTVGQAVEGALRLARQATGKDTVIALLGGYHGRTAGTLAVTSSSSSYRGHRAGPIPSGTVWAPYPYPYAGIGEEQALQALETLLLQQALVHQQLFKLFDLGFDSSIILIVGIDTIIVISICAFATSPPRHVGMSAPLTSHGICSFTYDNK